MKIYQIIFIVSLLIVSCSENKEIEKLDGNSEITTNLSKENRQPGMIPDRIEFMNQIQNNSHNKDALISILKEMRENHGNQDYYNNLFEMSVAAVFRTNVHNEFSNEDILFIMNEFNDLESSLLNIENIGSMVSMSKEKSMDSNLEIKTLATQILKKNKLLIESMEWKNADLQREKLAQVDKTQLNVNYLRAEAYENL